MNPLTRDVLIQELAEGAFGSGAGSCLPPRRLGAEAEFIPVDSLNGRRCPIDEAGVKSTLPFLRRFGLRQGWHEGRHDLGPWLNYLLVIVRRAYLELIERAGPG